jgi:hypothetical protein
MLTCLSSADCRICALRLSLTDAPAPHRAAGRRVPRREVCGVLGDPAIPRPNERSTSLHNYASPSRAENARSCRAVRGCRDLGVQAKWEFWVRQAKALHECYAPQPWHESARYRYALMTATAG